MKLKEGEIINCTICKRKIEGVDSFWEILRYRREIPHFPCKECGKEIFVEFQPAMDSFEIIKTCPCKFTLTSSFVEERKQLNGKEISGEFVKNASKNTLLKFSPWNWREENDKALLGL